ncbi:MAG: hypothetical protein A3E93_02610 [Candidatus Zambryskibacteria bacterium RIFCSPHIGHO2_12_FULL_43_12b]|nr:MAG: hypothetical protein A3E93_02610 [Candidatus Zambryskibacteria bacterium RIFCSPHIGHO2_12_FULL_43_12b]
MGTRLGRLPTGLAVTLAVCGAFLLLALGGGGVGGMVAFGGGGVEFLDDFQMTNFVTQTTNNFSVEVTKDLHHENDFTGCLLNLRVRF